MRGDASPRSVSAVAAVDRGRLAGGRARAHRGDAVDAAEARSRSRPRRHRRARPVAHLRLRTRDPVDVWAVRATVRPSPSSCSSPAGAHPVAIDDRTLDGSAYVLSELEYEAVATTSTTRRAPGPSGATSSSPSRAVLVVARRPRPCRRRPSQGAPMTAAHDALVAHLLAHSVRTGDFTLKSGKQSAWFIDAKQTTCRADGMLLVADAALEVHPRRRHRHRWPHDGRRRGGLRHRGHRRHPRPGAPELQRAQGGEGPRRRRPHRRSARARRPGRDHRGRRHPRRVDARGGRR